MDPCMLLAYNNVPHIREVTVHSTSVSGMCVHNYSKDRDAVLLTASFLTFDPIGPPIYIL